MTHEILKTVSEEQLLREAARSRENWKRLQKTYENEARRAGMQEGRQEGLQEGRQEGLQEGIQKRNLEIALTMKKENLPESVISRMTGLSPKEIEKL